MNTTKTTKRASRVSGKPAAKAVETTATRKPTAKPQKKMSPRINSIAPEQRQEMIAVAAYYRGEKRGFSNEGAIEDWVQAEMEVDRILNTQKRTRTINKSS